jgi:lipopolysaccharide export system permease protein
MIIRLYVLKQVMITTAFAIMALSMIFIVVDLLEHLDNFLDKKVGIAVIVRYYLSFLPSILTLLVPVGMLLGSLFAVGRLTNSNEVVAMRAAGQSLFHFLLPLLLFGVVMSGVQLWFNGWVAPKANTIKFSIERLHLARNPGGGSLYNMYFRNSPTSTVSIESYDEEKREAINVVLEEFSSVTQPRLVSRSTIRTMRYHLPTKRWVAEDGWKRTFVDSTTTLVRLAGTEVPFTIAHDQIARLRKVPGELTFTELADYIQTQQRGGKDTRRQEIDALGQWAFPWANVIVVLLAVPFATIKRRAGIAVNIAAAMIISVVYIACSKIVQAIGVQTTMPAVVIAWFANGLFALVGVVNLFRLRL